MTVILVPKGNRVARALQECVVLMAQRAVKVLLDIAELKEILVSKVKKVSAVLLALTV
jgi:hypothetical protein